MDIDKVKESARGSWLSIFSQFGIDVPMPPGKHGNCPTCSNGDPKSDRFRLDKDTINGTWFCNQCTPQAGDGFGLVQNVLGLDFIGAAKRIAEVLGVVSSDPKNHKPPTDPRIALNKVWSSSTPLTENDPVRKYILSRKLLLMPDNVRYCKDCYESETKANLPAMVARVQNYEGKPVSIHRTYLSGEGKAKIDSPKKLMPGTEPLSGSAIRLFMPDGKVFEKDTLGVAEGIETAMAAAQLFRIATWATISTSIMVGFKPPKEYRKIVIFSDNDSNFSGQKAAYILANKLYLDDLVVSVETPENQGEDWNDCLIEQQQTGTKGS